MERFLIRDKTGSPYKVTAPDFENACRKLNLKPSECSGEMLTDPIKNIWAPVDKHGKLISALVTKPAKRSSGGRR